MLIVNDENDHYFKQKAELMTQSDLEAYIDQFARTKVTHFFMCPNGQRTSYRSAVHEAIWDPVAGEMPNDVWCVNAKILHDKGIDPYEVWVRRCRHQGISPWLTMRMNDVHFVTTTNYFRNTTFWRTRSDLWRVPHATSGNWTDYAFDYSHQEVRDYHLPSSGNVQRYDFDDSNWTDAILLPHHAGKEKDKLHPDQITASSKTQGWDQTRNPIGLVPESTIRCGSGLGWMASMVQAGLVECSSFFLLSSSDFDIPFTFGNTAGRRRPGRIVPALTTVSLLSGHHESTRPRHCLCGGHSHTGARITLMFNWGRS